MTDIKTAGSLRSLITNIYISIMFLLFPLFTGFSGYANITFSKFLFFIICTGLWLIGLIIACIVEKSPLPRFSIHHWAATAFAAVCILSFIVSPYKSDSLLGASRYDGLITHLIYILIFLGVSFFGRFRPYHFICLAISVFICSFVAVFQLFNINLFSLFPGDFSHYDSGIRYSSAFLGTMGNTNVLSAFFCLALPVLFVLPLVSNKKLCRLGIIAMFPAVFVLVRARVAGGFVGLGLCALIAAPIVFTDIKKLCRALFSAAPLLVSASIALAYRPHYVFPDFEWTFCFDTLPLLALCGAAALIIIGAILAKAKNFSPSKKAMRLFFIAICLFAVLAGLIFVYFFAPSAGTIYELSQVLHGNIDDSFGSSRIKIWRGCLAIFGEHPLLGSGPDTLALRVDVHFSRYVPETGKLLQTSVDNAHNEYLGHLINTGIFGLTAYLFILILALIAFLKSCSRPHICALGLGCLCYCIQGFFALGLPLIAPLFWIALALLFPKDESLSELIM
ncbi:MAG: O-antigen ligase family protein [Ruminococcaceae bacterium]|nr:O-antigen ligase family protein [Oscillospiraceae bacterium]